MPPGSLLKLSSEGTNSGDRRITKEWSFSCYSRCCCSGRRGGKVSKEDLGGTFPVPRRKMVGTVGDQWGHECTSSSVFCETSLPPPPGRRNPETCALGSQFGAVGQIVSSSTGTRRCKRGTKQFVTEKMCRPKIDEKIGWVKPGYL